LLGTQEAIDIVATYQPPLSPWTWSESLMRSALHYVNEKGRDGSATESSAFLTGRDLYLSTACDHYEFEYTHNKNTA